jgi:hypothetical protein
VLRSTVNSPGSRGQGGPCGQPGTGRGQESPFPDELRHFLLHLFAFQLLLEQQFKPSHSAIALGILLIRLGRKQKHRCSEPGRVEYMEDRSSKGPKFACKADPSLRRTNSVLYSLHCPSSGFSSGAPAPMC